MKIPIVTWDDRGYITLVDGSRTAVAKKLYAPLFKGRVFPVETNDLNGKYYAVLWSVHPFYYVGGENI